MPSSSASSDTIRVTTLPYSPVLSFLSSRRWLLAKLLVWLLVWRLFIAIEFGAVFAAVSAIAFLFANLSSSSAPSKVSAYSAFNQGGARMAGQTHHQLNSHTTGTGTIDCCPSPKRPSLALSSSV